MPRPTLFDHPKFQRLVHVLRMPEPHVLGHLEYLWRVGYASGNPVIGDAVDVEIAAKWAGDAGVLCQALVQLRFLDEQDGIFAIHDLHENAPAYVKSRERMERFRKERQRLTKSEKTETQPLRNGYPSPTPAPAPAPTHAHKNTTRASRSGESSFDAFWEAYPRKVGKDAAKKVWQSRRLDADRDCILRALRWQRVSEQWLKDGGQFIPYPATYLRQGRWLDEPGRPEPDYLQMAENCPHEPRCGSQARCEMNRQLNDARRERGEPLLVPERAAS